MPYICYKDAANRKSAECGEAAGPGKFRGSSLKAFLRSKEKDYISYVLQECEGDKERAAKALGISLATFYRKYGETT